MLSPHSRFSWRFFVMKNFKLIVAALTLGTACIVPAVSFADCTADDQSTYNTCITSAATSCASSVSGCDSTVIQDVSSTGFVTATVTKCCARPTSRKQLSCASAQIGKYVIARTIIPPVYSAFRRTANAAIKELRTLVKDKTLCSTGSN